MPIAMARRTRPAAAAAAASAALLLSASNEAARVEAFTCSNSGVCVVVGCGTGRRFGESRCVPTRGRGAGAAASSSSAAPSSSSSSALAMAEKNGPFSFADLFGGGKDSEPTSSSSSSSVLQEGSTTLEKRNPIPVKPNRNQQPSPSSPVAKLATAGGAGAREGWDGLKDTIYSAADTLSSISREEDDADAALPRPIDGYADSVRAAAAESPPKRRPGETPAQAILRAMEEKEARKDWERSKMDYDAYNPSDEELELVETSGGGFFDSVLDAIGGGDEAKEDADGVAAKAEVAEEDKPRGFAAFKDGLYDAYDALSGKEKTEKKAAAPAKSARPVDRISDRTATFDPSQFRAQSRPNQNADPSLRLVDPSVIENLSSPNPIARAKAQYALRSAEERRRRRERDIKRRETAERVKEAAYGLGDGLIKGVEAVAGGVEAAARAARKAPEVTKKTVDTAKELPAKVKTSVSKTVDDVRGTVDETKRITTTVYEDIVNLPNAVQGKVDETKDTISSTKKSIEDTVTKTQDALYDAQATVGLKPKRPKPPIAAPPPPPKPIKAEDVARGVAGTFLKGTLWLGGQTLKGSLWLTGQGAKAVFNKATEGLRSQGKEGAAAAAEEIRDLTNSRDEVEAALIELSKVDEELGREVADALRLAEDALGGGEEASAAAAKPASGATVFSAKTEAAGAKAEAVSAKVPTPPSAPPAAPAKPKEKTALDKLNEQIEAESRASAKALAAKAAVAKPKPKRMFFTDEGSGRAREISDAVRKAREAAERAQRDAAELEKMLKGEAEEGNGGGNQA